MRKKVLLLIMMLSGLFLTLNVSALEGPELVEIDGEKLLFANGTPITISASDNGDGAIVSYGNGQSIVIPSDVYVFGGSHNDETQMTTSITMNGGKIAGILGGGLHKSHVTKATIVINDGQVGLIDGGGVASIFFDAPGVEEKSHVYNGSAIDSTTRVDEVSITINGGKICKLNKNEGLLYGGGMGYNYTGDVTININGGDLSYAYVTGGGSHGHTDSATINIKDGTINILQSVNRGTVGSATMTISGGIVNNAYVGGETADTSVTGTIGNSTLDIIGGEVKNVSVGSNGVDSSGNKILATEVSTLHYNSEYVDNVDESEFKAGSVVKTVTLTIKTSTGAIANIEISAGTIYNTEAINILKESIVNGLIGTGSSFDGFYNSDSYTDEYDFSKPIVQNTTIYVKSVQKREQNITNPETSDINVIASIGMIIISGLGLGYVVKKRRFN